MNSLLKVQIIDMLFNLLMSDRLGSDEVDQVNDIIQSVRDLVVQYGKKILGKYDYGNICR